MKPTTPRRRSSPLITLLLGTGLFAVAGGAALVARTDGSLLGLTLAQLEGAPFASYLVPGLALALLIGGTQLAAGIAVARGHRRGSSLAIGAGLVLAVWIAVQALMIGVVMWLQPVFFLLGIVEMMLVAANQPAQTQGGKRRFGQRHRR